MSEGKTNGVKDLKFGGQESVTESSPYNGSKD